VDGGKHGVGGRLAQAAKRRGLDVLAQPLQLFDVAFLALAVDDALQNLQHAPRADAARRALAAALVHGEIQEEAGDIHHAVVFVHHDHAAGTHHGADLGQRIVFDGYVQKLRRDAAARGAAGLHGLEFLAVGDAAPDVKNNFP
jgi:hypothetical protein